MASKPGLKPPMDISQEFGQEANHSLEEGIEEFGHYKQNKMDKAKLSSLMLHQPQCTGKTTTLGSIVSRILRSLGHARLTGIAPMGGLERKVRQLALGE